MTRSALLPDSGMIWFETRFVLDGVTMQEYLEIGKVANTHGVKGELKIISLTDDPGRFNKLKWVYVDKKGSMEKYDIEYVKFFKNFVIVKFKGLDDMAIAEGFKGLYLKVDRKNAVKLPKDSYFICDLIGCEVFDEASNKLGILKDILKTGSNDVYIVGEENQEEILIPALKEVVKKISIEERKVIVSLPEGLVDHEI